MKSFFHHLETCSRAEREAIAAELRSHYNSIVYAENTLYAALLVDKSDAARLRYNTAITALGCIQSIFSTLGIDYEPGQKFPNE